MSPETWFFEDKEFWDLAVELKRDLADPTDPVEEPSRDLMGQGSDRLLNFKAGLLARDVVSASSLESELAMLSRLFKLPAELSRLEIELYSIRSSTVLSYDADIEVMLSIFSSIFRTS